MITKAPRSDWFKLLHCDDGNSPTSTALLLPMCVRRSRKDSAFLSSKLWPVVVRSSPPPPPPCRKSSVMRALLFPTNDPEELAAALKKLRDDNQFRAELGRRGRERARGFTWEKMAETIVRGYEEL